MSQRCLGGAPSNCKEHTCAPVKDDLLCVCVPGILSSAFFRPSEQISSLAPFECSECMQLSSLPPSSAPNAAIIVFATLVRMHASEMAMCGHFLSTYVPRHTLSLLLSSYSILLWRTLCPFHGVQWLSAVCPCNRACACIQCVQHLAVLALNLAASNAIGFIKYAHVPCYSYAHFKACL